MDFSNSTVKNSESETENPTRIRPAKISAFTNGVLKRHAPLQLHHNGHFPVAVAYKECLKNHAATLGGHALDGCGEFMPPPPPSTPASLKCAACGCHRNFHRREPEQQPAPALSNAITALEFHPHHRNHPPPPQNNGESSPNDSPSPPPISSAYYPSAPHMLLALSHGNINNTSIPAAAHTAAAELNSGSRKRYRTKFTQFQKERMLEFAERVGWRMEKRNDGAMNEFCGEVGVDRAVFKVWMHNNKNVFAKKDQPPPPPHLSNNASETSTPPVPTANGNGAAAYHHQHDGISDVHGEEADQLHLLK